MSTAERIERPELLDVIHDAGLSPRHAATILRWLERGDSVLVYENADLGHPDLGHKKFVSYGSERAQIERTQFPEPPERLPDIGNDINWRYTLRYICEPNKETAS